MIFGDVDLDVFHIHAIANFTYQIPHTDCHVSKEYRFAILGYPYEMKFYIIDTMGGFATIFHNIASLLWSSLKGEGLSPILRRGN